MHDQPMEEEKSEDNIKAKSSCPLPSGLPINWGLITGPVPEPVFTAPSLGTVLPPQQSSGVHVLQTKAKSFTQRRTRGRDRETEKERLDADVLVSSTAGHISSEFPLRQKPQGKGQVSLLASSWRSVKNSNSSDEDEEVEVKVRLDIHSPPAVAQSEGVFQRQQGTELERTEKTEGQVSVQSDQRCGLAEGSSLESLLSDNSGSVKDNPSTRPPPPVFSCTSTTLSTSTTPSCTSSTTTRRWAPPKGFWRVARPETLLLNGVGPNNIPFASKDCSPTEALAETQRKSKTAEAGSSRIVGCELDDSNASSEFKCSDSMECLLDRYEQKEMDVTDPVTGLCSSDSWDSTSLQVGGLSADEKHKVKQRAYAKLRERRKNSREGAEQICGESTSQYGDATCRVDCEGTSPERNIMSYLSNNLCE